MRQNDPVRRSAACHGLLLAAAIGTTLPVLATAQTDHSQHSPEHQHAGPMPAATNSVGASMA